MRRIGRIFLWFLIAIALAAGLLTATGGWSLVWRASHGPADMGSVDFATLEKTAKPNQALICPEDQCARAEPDTFAPIFDVSANELERALLSVLESESDLTRVDDGSDKFSLRFVQRTRLLRFPDTIRIRILPLGEGRSTLAAYSQSQVGQSDLGINRQRLERWLGKLRRELGE